MLALIFHSHRLARVLERCNPRKNRQTCRPFVAPMLYAQLTEEHTLGVLSWGAGVVHQQRHTSATGAAKGAAHHSSSIAGVRVVLPPLPVCPISRRHKAACLPAPMRGTSSNLNCARALVVQPDTRRCARA